VKSRLVELGVSEGRLEVVGHGERRPWVNGLAEDVRAKNRRVEFRIITLDEKLAASPVAAATHSGVSGAQVGGEAGEDPHEP